VNLLRRIRARLAANRQDYVDWLKIPREYNFVAIDAVDSLDLKGRVVWQAGRPVAFTDPVHPVDGRWIFTAAHPGDLPAKPPAYVAAEAIIGPLPPAAHSLRVRPGRLP